MQKSLFSYLQKAKESAPTQQQLRQSLENAGFSKSKASAVIGNSQVESTVFESDKHSLRDQQ